MCDFGSGTWDPLVHACVHKSECVGLRALDRLETLEKLAAVLAEADFNASSGSIQRQVVSWCYFFACPPV